MELFTAAQTLVILALSLIVVRQRHRLHEVQAERDLWHPANDAPCSCCGTFHKNDYKPYRPAREYVRIDGRKFSP